MGEFLPASNEPDGWVQNINAVGNSPIGGGIGLPAGRTAYLGTVTFHKDAIVNGSFEIFVGTNGPNGIDAVLALDPLGEDISEETTFNSAFVHNVGGELLCTDFQGNYMEIEVNALRAGGKTVSTGPNRTVDVTAKARILKGTAVSDTTIDMTLTIDAVDGTTVIGTNSTAFEAVRLEVGKGGKGDKLTVDVPQCTSGIIAFTAKFSGTDDEGDFCGRARTLRRACK